MEPVIIYKIFLASPQDVLEERERFKRTVNCTNMMLSNMKVSARLELYAWEQVPPGLGLPEEVILQRIPIKDCDIFVAIFWKRLGSPPGTFGTNGKPFLSGTEQEIEEAIHARSQNEKKRPAIMIFLKTDPIPAPAALSKEDIEQLGRLKQYLERFEVGGEHPALVTTFKSKRSAKSDVTKQFEFVVMSALLTQVKEFMEQDGVN